MFFYTKPEPEPEPEPEPIKIKYDYDGNSKDIQDVKFIFTDYVLNEDNKKSIILENLNGCVNDNIKFQEIVDEKNDYIDCVKFIDAEQNCNISEDYCDVKDYDYMKDDEEVGCDDENDDENDDDDDDENDDDENDTCVYALSIDNIPCYYDKNLSTITDKIDKIVKKYTLKDIFNDTYINYKNDREIQLIKNLDFILFSYNYVVHTFIIHKLYDMSCMTQF
jgi:hypothetical protein